MLLFLLSGGLLAENWHPFPFQIAYYGKRANLQQPGHPANNGYLVDALYLNQTTFSGSGQIRQRDLQRFPLAENNYPGEYNIQLGNLVVSDYPGETQIQAEPEGLFQAINGIFRANELKPGGKPFGPEWSISSMAAISHFGMSDDSIAHFTRPGIQLTLSKKLGILQYKTATDSVSWLGTKDLDIGFQDAHGRMKVPSIGDQFHYRISKFGGFTCTGQWGTSSDGAAFAGESRMTVTGVSGDYIDVDEMVSDPGSSTGVLYQRSYPYFGSDYGLPGFNLSDSLAPIGCPAVLDAAVGGQAMSYKNVGWLGDNGFPFTIMVIEAVDLAPTYYFTNCLKKPFSTRSDYFPFQNPLIFCTGEPISARYIPVYQQSATSCSSGTPLPSVTVTEVQSATRPQPIRLVPQPAQASIRFVGIDSGELRLFTHTGAQVLETSIGTQALSIAHLPPGLYLYQIRSTNSPWQFGKMVKE